VSGGLRAVQMERLHVTTLKMMPMVEGVAVPMVASHIDDSGVFGSNELIDASAKTLLDELFRWAEALRPMRR
jgi:NAD(P)H-dependent FMN reductase